MTNTKYHVDPDALVLRPEEGKVFRGIFYCSLFLPFVLLFGVNLAHWIAPENYVFFDRETIFSLMPKLEEDYALLVSYDKKAFAERFIHYYFNLNIMLLISVALTFVIYSTMIIFWGHPVPKFVAKPYLTGMPPFVIMFYIMMIEGTFFRKPHEQFSAKFALSESSYFKVWIIYGGLGLILSYLTFCLAKFSLYAVYDWRKIRKNKG